jgi:nitroreductase
MNFDQLVLNRQSVRKYISKKVEKDKLEKCIETARIAPSASNAQPWKFIIIDEPEIKEKVASETYGKLISFNKFVHEAPVIVAIVIEKPNFKSQFGARVKDKDFYLIDIGILAAHFCLQATELGLGTCILGWFNEKQIIKILNIPKNKRIGILISVGYSPEDYKLRTKIRKEQGKILSFNKY